MYYGIRFLPVRPPFCTNIWASVNKSHTSAFNVEFCLYDSHVRPYVSPHNVLHSPNLYWRLLVWKIFAYLSIHLPTYLSINLPLSVCLCIVHIYLSVICLSNSQAQVFVSNGVRVPQLPAHSLSLSRSKPTCAADGAPLSITVNLHSPLWGVATSRQPNLESVGAVWQTGRVCRGKQCLDSSH